MNGSTAESTGYVAISLPDTGDWQGFFVMPAYADAGRRMIALAQEVLITSPGGTEIRKRLGGDGVENQELVGALSAAAVEFFIQGVRNPQPEPAQATAIMAGMGAVAWALTETAGERWMLVTGRTEPGRTGLATSVATFDAPDLEAAKNAISAEVGRARIARDIRDAFVGLGMKRRGS